MKTSGEQREMLRMMMICSNFSPRCSREETCWTSLRSRNKMHRLQAVGIVSTGIYYQNIRGQLYQKLEGLLEKKVSTYSKKDLVQIMLCGEKPHLPEKFYHNKFIFFSVQTFLLKTKRLIAYNKPRPLAPPPHESD